MESKFDELNIEKYPNLRLENVTSNGIIAFDKSTNTKIELEADNIVLATGLSPEKKLGEGFERRGILVYSIGDCVEPRRILDAVYEGFLIGLAIE